MLDGCSSILKHRGECRIFYKPCVSIWDLLGSHLAKIGMCLFFLFLVQTFGEWCGITVLTTACYWPSIHCIPAQKVCVHLGGVKSQPFTVGVGLLQGCVLQIRHQKVFSMGALRLCGRVDFWKFDKNSTDTIGLRISIWEAWSFVWGGNPPRGDGTGVLSPLLIFYDSYVQPAAQFRFSL